MSNQDITLYTESENGRRLLKLLMRSDVYSKLILDPEEVFEIVPEARAMVGFDQCNPHHPYDVWVHTAHSVAYAPKDPVLRLALLMHDVGKPSTFYFTEDAVGHFNKHNEKGEKILRARLPLLGLDAGTVETIAILVRYHDSDIYENERESWVADLGRERLLMLRDLMEADARAHDEKYKTAQIAEIESLRGMVK